MKRIVLPSILFLAIVAISIPLLCANTADGQAKPAPKSAQASEPAQAGFSHIPTMSLTVVRVIDDDFTPISDSDVKQMLKTARHMYKDKFGADNVRFVDSGQLRIEEFFQRYLDKNSEAYHQKDARRFRIGSKNDFGVHEDSIMAFIRQWKVEELQGFFAQSERSRYDSYEAIYAGIVQQMSDKIAYIATLKSGGKPLLRSEKAEYRSFLNWLVALELQKDYDVVLTNTFILYDDMSKPSPHSIFSTAKVGGVSHKNEFRQVLGERVIMGSTFGMDTDLAFFSENDGKPVSRQRRNEVTGAFVIAHELGHAIFKLPDHYDHPPECLMNNNKELSYSQGYEVLLTHPGPCPRCHQWMQPRGAFFEGDYHFGRGEYKAALDRYMVALRQTPQNIDGYRPRYMAEIAYKMSKCYHALGQLDLAKKGAASAAKLYPWDTRFKQWQDTLTPAPKPAPGDAGK